MISYFVVGDGFGHIFLFKILWENVPFFIIFILIFEICHNVEVIIIFLNKIKVYNLVLYIHTCARWHMCIFVIYKQLLNFRVIIKGNYILFNCNFMHKWFQNIILHCNFWTLINCISDDNFWKHLLCNFFFWLVIEERFGHYLK